MVITSLYPPRTRDRNFVDIEPKQIEPGQRWLRAIRVSWLPEEVIIQGMMPFHALVYHKNVMVAIHVEDLLIYFRRAA